jgi:hypothetical protein
VLLFVPGCGGGGGAGGSGGGSSSKFVILDASNGFGKLLPHQIAIKDDQGLPTNQVVEITNVDTLVREQHAHQPRPAAAGPGRRTAELPNGKGRQPLRLRALQPGARSDLGPVAELRRCSRARSEPASRSRPSIP